MDERPVYLDFTRPDHKKAGAANIRVGVGVMAWSSDGRYLATKCTNLATTVWVWDLARWVIFSSVRSLRSRNVCPRVYCCAVMVSQSYSLFLFFSFLSLS